MICVICKNEIEEQYTEDGIMYWDQGNNAEPIAEGRCCDKCDQDIVLPHRLADAMINKEV